LGCRKKGLRAPTCAVAFLILDLHLFKMRFCSHKLRRPIFKLVIHL
jgi:hypothetical protein